MKVKMLLILCLCSGYVTAQHNDPFNKNQRKTLQQQEIKEEQLRPVCQPLQNVIAADIPFNQLKMIGFLQYKTQVQILFHDEKQVFSAMVGDFIAQEQFKIYQIHKNSVQLNKLRQDCSAGDIISIKF